MSVFKGDRFVGGDGYDDLLFDSVAPWTPEAPVGWLDGGDEFDSLLLLAGLPVTLSSTAAGMIRVAMGGHQADVIRFESVILDAADDRASLLGIRDRLEVHAGGGNDVLVGSGAVNLYGDDGDDRIELRLGDVAGEGEISGGPGRDTLLLGAGLSLDLRSATAFGSNAAFTVTEFEEFRFLLGGIGATAHGDAGADRFVVEPGADGGARVEFFGGAGDDWLAGGRGDDLLDGGDGTDTAAYDGFFRQSVVTPGQVSGPAGTDTLRSIERLAFADGTLSLGADDAWAQVVRLYDTVHQRAPDRGGLDWHTARMVSGEADLFRIAADFLNSPEFQTRTSGLTDGEFVSYLYQTAQRRAPDPSGLAYWTQQLADGMTRPALLVMFSESAEHRAATAASLAGGYFTTDAAYQDATLLYQAGLGRLPDMAGLLYWGEALKTGHHSLASFATGLAGSAEFAGKTDGLGAGDFVDYLYQNTLHRAADAGGRAYWVAQLEGGQSAASLLLSFALSPEHRTLMGPHITDGIDVML